MLNGVSIDDQLWLVDVGFPGPSYIEPIRLTEEELATAKGKHGYQHIADRIMAAIQAL